MMKFISPLVMFLLIASIATAAPSVSKVKSVKNRGEIDKIQCDKTVMEKIHLGDSCNFYVSFTADNTKAHISDIKFWFWSDKEYNGNDGPISFKPTKELEDADWVVDNKTIKLLESSDYNVRVLPDTPSDDNIILKYEILFNKINQDGTVSPEEERFVQCGRYSVRK
ncbi:MAG: hypothetical protein IJU65_01770 [Desulfovibrio sp.]|nr:hypothetical protein [Desulfovibrio sp.]